MEQSLISVGKSIILGLLIGYTIVNYININATYSEVQQLKTEKISGWGNE